MFILLLLFQSQSGHNSSGTSDSVSSRKRKSTCLEYDSYLKSCLAWMDLLAHTCCWHQILFPCMMLARGCPQILAMDLSLGSLSMAAPKQKCPSSERGVKIEEKGWRTRWKAGSFIIRPQHYAIVCLLGFSPEFQHT